MKVTNFRKVRSFKDVLDACRTTINKESLGKEPSDSWKAKIILAGHSPLRYLEFDWKWEDIKSWSATHFGTHTVGAQIGMVECVGTQRSDRTGVNRDDLPQGALVNMNACVNAEALLNISQKRLCKCASKETRDAWKLVLDKVAETEPILAEKCVPTCVYRGFCPEHFGSCGYDKTEAFNEAVKKYRNVNYE